MRYTNISIMIPYEDNGTKNYVCMGFKGIADKRRIRREIRRYCKRQFNKTVPIDFIKYDCLWVDSAAGHTPSAKTLDTFQDLISELHVEASNEEEASEFVLNSTD